MRFRKIYLEISNLCNLKCEFCPGTKRKPRRLTVDEMKEYAVNCLEIGTDVYSSDGDIIGTVEEIKAVSSDNSRGNSDGAEYNGIYKVKIKISSGAVMSRRSINANGQIIASGQTIPFTSNGVSLSGTCSDVTFGYYDGGQNDEQ